ncbi:hypothetical protein [Burkholderia sp. USMB20]|uniref:hypothetical protein n=1 Tax=Burkholderia sp. USMB20 TaxID=1571773 RepID=UPI000A8F08C7|nr:hypothetical protein [Burkholderia sp. USMB20]TGN94564.1 hypothetical protein PL79_027555 [Burkholderia sp. USMB20]
MKHHKWLIALLTLAAVAGASVYCHYPATDAASAAAWVQAAGSIGAILIAIWVANKQYRDTREAEVRHAADDARKELAETLAFVQAIREEINAIWEGYNVGARQQLLAVPEGGFFDAIFPVTTEAFTVYNRASSQVGKIADEELRRLIIVTYAKAKGLIYSFQLNNHLVTDLMNFDVSYHGQDRDARIRRKHAILVQYADQLKSRDRLVHESMIALLQRGDEWLRSER